MEEEIIFSQTSTKKTDSKADTHSNEMSLSERLNSIRIDQQKNRVNFELHVEAAHIKPIDGVWDQISIGEDASNGEGTLSFVRRAKVKGGLDYLRGGNIIDTTSNVIVKIPNITNPETTNDYRRKRAQDYILHEGQVLQLIRAKQQELFPGHQPSIPDAVLVTQPNSLPAIVMEEIPQVNKLNNLAWTQSINADDLHIALTQYFELIAAGYELGFCDADKLIQNCYYFPDNKRLVKLDWNLTSLTQDETAVGGTLDEIVLKRMQLALSEFQSIDRDLDQNRSGLSPDMKRKLTIFAESLKTKKGTIKPTDIAMLISSLPHSSEEDIRKRV